MSHNLISHVHQIHYCDLCSERIQYLNVILLLTGFKLHAYIVLMLDSSINYLSMDS